MLRSKARLALRREDSGRRSSVSAGLAVIGTHDSKPSTALVENIHSLYEKGGNTYLRPVVLCLPSRSGTMETKGFGYHGNRAAGQARCFLQR